MLISEFDKWCKSFLEIDSLKGADISMNGLQVGDLNAEIKKIAFAVDASLFSFEKSIEAGADLLFVHHGLYWGAPVPIVGDFYKRISTLVKNNLALYAVHLPLDISKEVGNNYEIAKRLNLINLEPFGSTRGVRDKIGVKGTLENPLSTDEIVLKLFGTWEEGIKPLNFGKDKNKKVAILSGSCARSVFEAIDEECNLFITGEPSHAVYHNCYEAGINLLFAGHYLTETFGVKAVSEKVLNELGLEVCYIDKPTGL